MGLIRKLMIEARNRLEDRDEKSLAIGERFLSVIPDDLEAAFIFADIDSEVSTKYIIGTLLERGVEVCCPKVVDRDIYFFRIGSLSDLKPCYHNIPEPDVEEEGKKIADVIAEKEVIPESFEKSVMAVPGVVFDEQGGRMGYGAGMYDRYLAKHPCWKVALAFDIQVREKPMTLKETDVRVDGLVTETRFLRFDQ